MKNRTSVYYIENLTADAWMFSILPYFLKNGKRALQETEHIYYFNYSRSGLRLAKMTSRLLKKSIEKAGFKQGEIRGQDGHLIWMKSQEDVLSIRDEIIKDPEFQKVLENGDRPNSLRLFLTKWIMCSDLTSVDAFQLMKFSFFVRSVEQQENFNVPIRTSGRDVFIFMQERPWFAQMRKFVELRGINVVPTGNLYFYLKIFLLRFGHLKFSLKEFCKKMAYHWMVLRHRLENKGSGGGGARRKNIDNTLPRLAVEYYGYLNFDAPELFSDVFFLNKSSLSPEDILIYFGLPKSPITDQAWNEVGKQGMSAVVINPRAAATPNVPLFEHKSSDHLHGRRIKIGDKENGLNHKWLHHFTLEYNRRYDYWTNFIKQHNVKIHVTWFRYGPDHCVILDALRNTGGAGVVYERSFEHFPTFGNFTMADVVFGFSRRGAHLGRDNDSRIPYYVITGYLGDHRFSLLRKKADEIRSRVKSNGARKIVAYFDEHATDHQRWDLAYQVTVRNYSFLLNKVLDDPRFGLILKPKVPSTVRSRLGPVSQLLRQAEATGRCFMFENSNLQGSYPPAAAALGADIAIHGHLFAATAGVESALAGTPTLILDSEGVPESSLYNSEKRQIIFKDIEQLWHVCREHWTRPDGVPGFADWSDILDDLDPFRDGRAAERMGAYLGWLMDGFKAGLPRETVLADAAQRYSEQWGKDKILSVNIPGKELNQDCLTQIG